MTLRDLVGDVARRTPDALAVGAPDRDLTYRELDGEADDLARALDALGVSKGDRVALWLDKSSAMVVAMQAVLRLGAAYVPIDPTGPAARAAIIVRDCQASAVIAPVERLQLLSDADPTFSTATVEVKISDGAIEWSGLPDVPLRQAPEVEVRDDDLVYILYTSGSTGVPKGVCISDRNAMAFIEWASGELAAESADRFANHAPFHFDLSVLDVYVAFRVGASVHLIPFELSYAPVNLVELIADRGITVWYSVPSVLVLMLRDGGLDEVELPDLRAVLFAGEPFPINWLRALREVLPSARMLNLYGPTETNVCTFHEVHQVDDERISPVPIGRACSGDTVWAVGEDGAVVGQGEEGELLVSGPTVMLGYWGGPAWGEVPYPTGDRVRVLADDSFEYLGRRDNMVKVGGVRMDLGEIENALYQHDQVSQAAVVAVGEGLEKHLVAVIEPVGEAVPGLLDIKRHCAELLPRSMIVARVRGVEALPRNANGKVDRRRLVEVELAEGSG